MHPKSGMIFHVKDEEEARASGLIPLFDGEMERLSKLSSKNRPKALLEMRMLHPLARLPGLTGDDIRKLRNAAKRERKERR